MASTVRAGEDHGIGGLFDDECSEVRFGGCHVTLLGGRSWWRRYAGGDGLPMTEWAGTFGGEQTKGSRGGSPLRHAGLSRRPAALVKAYVVLTWGIRVAKTAAALRTVGAAIQKSVAGRYSVDVPSSRAIAAAPQASSDRLTTVRKDDESVWTLRVNTTATVTPTAIVGQPSTTKPTIHRKARSPEAVSTSAT